ncbi:MAG: hypothetical protein M1832_005516 [Thelocarpon impressellum]|nr:MAG: hypothetical protein M1832_005516 [Thelocarpon impressellum]
MSLRITPASAHPTQHASSTATAPSAPGLPDALRASTATASNTTPSSSHPLETRLQKWAATQEALKLQSLRRTFGIAEPVRRGMELRICDAGEWRPAVLSGGSSGVHGDILRGREAEMGWEDVWRGDETRPTTDFHTEMEGRLRMNW